MINERFPEKTHGELLRTQQMQGFGISRTTISRLAREGQLERVAHGIYTLADDAFDPLYVLASRSEKIIFSHQTALFLHDLSERTPFIYDVTIPSTAKLSASMREECRAFYVKDELHDIGKVKLDTKMGHTVWGYDVERTICDLLRNRSRMDGQVLVAAMKSYATCNHQDFDKLRTYAEAFRVTKLLRQYLEVLL